MKKCIFLTFVFSLFLIIPSFFVCRGEYFGEELVEIEKKIEEVKDENTVLEKEIVDIWSCEKIFTKAKARGFTP